MAYEVIVTADASDVIVTTVISEVIDATMVSRGHCCEKSMIRQTDIRGEAHKLFFARTKTQVHLKGN